MDRVNELKSFIALTENLQKLIDFYCLPYGVLDLFGKRNYSIPYVDSGLANNIFSELKQIESTTSEDRLQNYISLKKEIRHKLLLLISEIPIGERAKEIYLKNYEIYLKHCEYLAEEFGDSQDFLFHPVLNPESDWEPIFVRKRDSFEKWKSGDQIPDIRLHEKILDAICISFKTKRKYVNSNSSFGGFTNIKFKANIDFIKLSELLANDEWIDPLQTRTCNALLTGDKTYEPLYWKEGLSDLNKFIVTIYTLGMKGQSKPAIDWKYFSSCILVNDEFPISNNLKGAFTPKTRNDQELRPFAAIVKQCLIKNYPTPINYLPT